MRPWHRRARFGRQKKKKRQPKGVVFNLFSRFPRKEALRVLPAADRARSQRHVTTKADISRSLVQAKSLDRESAISKRKEKKQKKKRVSKLKN